MYAVRDNYCIDTSHFYYSYYGETVDLEMTDSLLANISRPMLEL